jgi:nicotinamide-nucleotide amidase
VVAEILTIGDELLIGQVVNTNSAWIATQLNLSGITVARMTTVADDRESITVALHEAEQRADLVIITGGLGPTKDDITRSTIADFLDVPLVQSAEALQQVTEFFKVRGRALDEINSRQALIPQGSIVIANKRGTAPGIWVKSNDTVFVSLPGVPFEMMAMMNEFVLPKIKSDFNTMFIYHVTVLTQGIGESALAEMIADWEDSLQSKDLKLAYLPHAGTVRLRISATGRNEQEVRARVDHEVNTLRLIIEKFFCGFEVFGSEENRLEKIVSEMLRERKQTVALAESCSGGYLSSLFTVIPGASEVFRGAVIPYANAMKTQILDVDDGLFTTVGAVSREVVEQLARNVQLKFNSDYAISVSGIAGPSGATAEKPVGTIWIAVASRDKVYPKKFQFGTQREQNIKMTANAALNMLRKVILKGEID